MPPDEKPDFGPSGYLPERASKRARKIILRAPLGMQWVVGAIVAGVVLLVAGAVFLRTSDDPPPPPWTVAGEVEQFGAAEIVDLATSEGSSEVLIVTAGGRIRAFADAPEARYCASSNLLQASDGRSWTLIGRGLAGVASLDQHPTLVQDGTLYVDATQVSPGPEPASRTPPEGCA